MMDSKVDLPPDAVAALRAAFGQTPVQDLETLTGGMSRTLIVGFTVDGAGYVLRRSASERVPETLTCARLAGERGVGPRVVHSNEATGYCVMERVKGPLFGSDPAMAPGRTERVASTLRCLHDGPAFPGGPALPQTLAFFDSLSRRTSGQGVPSSLAGAIEAVAPAMARFAFTAPCHRDLNPNNIFEREEGAVFVDWDTAAQGDPYVDLAQLGVFAFRTPAARDALLEAYLGRGPTEQERDRSLLARVAALGVYALSFRQVQAVSGMTVGADVRAPALDDLFAAMATQRERTNPALVALALARETEELAASEGVVAARARLDR
jgi:aminoglycoside phosphotransferase (APT) family kinase protein